jgi:ATP-dependent DNA helicase PIF1
MMSLKIFEILDDLGRILRNRNVPFGGIQIIFTGDFFQLPPVPTIGESDTERFCFESQKWFQVFKSENHIELTTIFRQKDEEYIEILSEIRKGDLSEKNIDALNAYVNRNFEPEKHEGLIPPKIFPLRSRVDQINSLMFSKLDEDPNSSF